MTSKNPKIEKANHCISAHTTCKPKINSKLCQSLVHSWSSHPHQSKKQPQIDISCLNSNTKFLSLLCSAIVPRQITSKLKYNYKHFDAN